MEENNNIQAKVDRQEEAWEKGRPRIVPSSTSLGKKMPVSKITPQELVQAILGSIIFAAGVNLFVVPAGIYNGGVLGISQLLYFLVQHVAPDLAFAGFTSAVYYILNLPLFFLSYRTFGRNYFIRNVMCVTVETIALAWIPVPKTMIVDSVLTSTMIGGLTAGVGAGLIFRSRSAAGGLDIVGVYLTQRFKDFSVGRLTIGVNLVIYTICAITMDVSVAIYSLIYSFTNSMTIDRLHEQNICTEMTIFTKKDPQRIIHYITQQLHHSANYWEATSGYSGDKEYIIYTVVSKYDTHKLDTFIKHYDEHVFAVKSNGVSLDGNFKKYL